MVINEREVNFDFLSWCYSNWKVSIVKHVMSFLKWLDVYQRLDEGRVKCIPLFKNRVQQNRQEAVTVTNRKRYVTIYHYHYHYHSIFISISLHWPPGRAVDRPAAQRCHDFRGTGNKRRLVWPRGRTSSRIDTAKRRRRRRRKREGSILESSTFFGYLVHWCIKNVLNHVYGCFLLLKAVYFCCECNCIVLWHFSASAFLFFCRPLRVLSGSIACLLPVYCLWWSAVDGGDVNDDGEGDDAIDLSHRDCEIYLN